MALRSVFRARMWKLSSQAEGWMIGTPHRLPGIAVVIDMPAPGERLEGDAQAALAGSFLRSAAARSIPPRLSADTLLQIMSGSQPSSCITSNLRSARANTRCLWSFGIPSKSRNGCSARMPIPSWSVRRRTSRGELLKVIRAFSKISAASNLAAARHRASHPMFRSVTPSSSAPSLRGLPNSTLVCFVQPLLHRKLLEAAV